MAAATLPPPSTELITLRHRWRKTGYWSTATLATALESALERYFVVDLRTIKSDKLFASTSRR